MRLFRPLSRVAFICNVCFLLASFVQQLPHPPEGESMSLIIIAGYIMAILINVLLNLSLGVLLAFNKLRAANIPTWILIVNFIFFIIQAILILIPLPQ